MSKKIACHIALSDSPETAGRIVEALAADQIDRIIVVYHNPASIASFDPLGDDERLSVIESSFAFKWIGDGMRDVSAILADSAGLDDLILLTSSALAEPGSLPVRYLFAAATHYDLTYRNYMLYSFADLPQKFGLFDDCVVRGSVVHDPLFAVFWKNLTPGLTEIRDRFYAQSYFFENFSPRYRTQTLFPLTPEEVAGKAPAMAAKRARTSERGKPKPPAARGKAKAPAAGRGKPAAKPPARAAAARKSR
jgi:hypothetical protein